VLRTNSSNNIARRGPVIIYLGRHQFWHVVNCDIQNARSLFARTHVNFGHVAAHSHLQCFATALTFLFQPSQKKRSTNKYGMWQKKIRKMKRMKGTTSQSNGIEG